MNEISKDLDQAITDELNNPPKSIMRDEQLPMDKMINDLLIKLWFRKVEMVYAVHDEEHNEWHCRLKSTKIGG